MMKALRMPAMLMALGVLTASAGHAQVAGPPGAAGNDVATLNLYAGGYSPTSSLVDGSEFRSSGTVGGSITVWVHPLVGVRANLLYAQTDVSGEAPEPLAGEIPNIWAYSGDLVLRLPRAMGTGRDTWFPYLVGGLGAKTYDFDELDSETNFAGSFGAGVEYRFARWGIQAEVRDVVSRFDQFDVDRTQHDVVWTAGATLSF